MFHFTEQPAVCNSPSGPVATAALPCTPKHASASSHDAQTSTPPVDTRTIATTVDEVLSWDTVFPRFETLLQTERMLHGHLHALLPHLQRHLDTVPPHSAEHRQAREYLQNIEALLRCGLGNGLVSADRYVRALARQCQGLLIWYERQQHAPQAVR